MAAVRCPSCDQQLEVENQYRDWTVRCPHCEHEFVPNDVRDAAREDEKPRRRRRDEDDDRDRDREPDGVPEDVRQEALQIVAAPALWLEICGWLTALCGLGLGALLLVLAGEVANNPQANDDDGVLVFMGFCGGVLMIPYGICMAIGARSMRNLSSRGWALAAAILGVGTFAIVGFCGIIHIGLGAWALTTLDTAEVREVFGVPKGRRRRRRGPDWD